MTKHFDPNIERAVLSTLLFEPKDFPRIKEHLTTDTFFLDIHKDIYRAMLELERNDKPISDDFLQSLLIRKNPNFESHLLEVMSAKPITNINSYIKELQEMHLRREIKTLTHALNEEKVTIYEFQEKLRKIEKTYENIEKQKNYEKIDYSRLPTYISNLTKDLSKINNYPVSMVLSTVLSSMAGLIGARAKISNGANITVFPVIWSMIVAPSSLSAKSTLFKFTKECIFGDIQNELYSKYEKDLVEYKSELKRYQRRSKGDNQKEAEPELPHPKLLIFANDGSPEAKIINLNRNQNGGVVYYDEMKAELERSNKDPRYKALKTSIFDGELYHKELVKDGGTFILHNPVLSEVGLITEQWLLEAIKKNDIASGFMARYLFSYNGRSDFKPLQITQHVIECDRYNEVGLFVIKMLEIDRKEPLLFTLSPKAKSYYIKWFNSFSKTAYEIETDEEITASYRLSTYVLKFALIAHIFEYAYKKIDVVSSEMYDISQKCIKTAIYLMEIFQNENHKVLELFERNKKLNFKIDDVAIKLSKKIQASKEKKLSKTEATNGIRGLTKMKLDNLIGQGIFKVEKVGRKNYISEA